MPSRRIAIVVYSPFPRASGGRETWLANLLPSLSDAGYETTVYSRSSSDPIVHNIATLLGLRLRPIDGISLPPAKLRHLLLNVPAAIDIATFVRRTRVALEADGFGDGVVLGLGPIIDVVPGLRLRRRYPSTRVVCAVHGRVAQELGHSLPWARPFLGRAERSTIRYCNLVLANGDDTRNWLRTLGVESAVVPNGVDIARFMRAPATLPQPIANAKARGEAVILMIATLRDIKGVRPFIVAMPALRDLYGPKFQAIFVGKGDTARYLDLARRLSVAEHVLFADEQSDVVPWLHGATISVNLSGGTGMAISAIEAMAAGVPVVAWDTPVYRQMLNAEQTALLVPDGDSARLASALARLLSDESLRERLANAGGQAARRFSWEAAAAALLEALDPLFSVDANDGRSLR